MNMSTAGLLCITGHLPAPAPADPSPDWSPQAGCRGRYDLFDETLGPVSSSRRDAVADLQKMCVECPVRRQCLLSGKQTRSWGIWGGFYLYAGQPQQRDRGAVAGYLDDTESELLSKTHIELTNPAQPENTTPATAA